jgi:transposase InsO family protein
VEKQRNGKRMYVITAIDLYTRTAFAIGTKSHGSKTTAHFFSLVMQLFPYEVKYVLTDNGSEFKKYFRELLKEAKLTHYHTKPRTPKMNAHCESFNGTIQAEFVDFNGTLLFDDVSAFNDKLRDYLIFYNTKRVHYAFKNKRTPFAVLNRSKYYVSRLPRECKNGWGQSKN